MSTEIHLGITEVEQQVCEIAAKQLNVPRSQVVPRSRLIEDLRCDSLELLELLMELEDGLDVTLPDEPPNSVYKSVFTRTPFRIRDLAELVYLQQGSGRPHRKTGRRRNVVAKPGPPVPFSQLGGSWDRDRESRQRPLFEPLPSDSRVELRRQSDGMRCTLLPSAEVEIGSEGPESPRDEQPIHNVELDSFLIDAEPVSTTAYCRFLNSVDANEQQFADWFLLDPEDDRIAQVQIEKANGCWQPVAGTETIPIVLVSWFGANAYSRWANDADWRAYHEEGFLPSEAQWEYAARGCVAGTTDPEAARDDSKALNCARHVPGNTYRAEQLPLWAVHQPSGASPFGLHHMGGNVWQWCRDWYDEHFNTRSASRCRNAVNRIASGVRSERGGSWVGPANLCRPSHRRGRAPSARGRCLGFRCVSLATNLPVT